MIHLIPTKLHDCFAGLPQTFDSHDVIRQAMRLYPQEYVRELYENVAQQDPIQFTHALLGKALAAHPELEKVTRDVSGNVRGGENDNQVWRRK
jgi:lipopolysaccharide biosynthesis regulator YciM